MRRFPLVLLGLLAGCGNKRIPMEAELVEITPDALVVEIKTTPGVRVDFGMTVDRNGGTLVPPEGKVRLKYPRKGWSGYSGDQLELAAGKRSFGRESWGSMRLDTPALIKSYLRIEKEGELWFGALRVGEKAGGSGTMAFNLGEEELAVRIEPKAKTVPVVIAAPVGAEVKIGESKLESEKPGIAEGDLPLRELALGTTLGEKPTIKLPVVVKKGDESAKFALELAPYSNQDIAFVNGLVLAELDALADGKVFPARPTINETIIVRTDADSVKLLGKPGVVGDARFVAIQTATRRDGESCSYNTFSKKIRYDDIEVRVLEARTGKELGKKKFAAPYVSCPQFAMSDDYFVWQAPEEKLTEWTQKIAFGK